MVERLIEGNWTSASYQQLIDWLTADAPFLGSQCCRFYRAIMPIHDFCSSRWQSECWGHYRCDRSRPLVCSEHGRQR